VYRPNGLPYCKAVLFRVWTGVVKWIVVPFETLITIIHFPVTDLLLLGGEHRWLAGRGHDDRIFRVEGQFDKKRWRRNDVDTTE
jgi:hypothetical protein